MNWFKKNMVTVLLVMAFFIGVGLLIYPTFSDYWNSFHQSRAIMTYASDISKLPTEEYEKAIASAEDYNAALAKQGVLWNMTDAQADAYDAELNVAGTGVMGYLDIPKIGVRLPVYHGTSDTVLQTSIGHIEGSSLPVGGEDTHSILSGHRGLPSARLFTDLDKLVLGDTWTIHVLNETLTYEADRIRIVEPYDLSELNIVKGKDYCTLVTCTPYGINTHRLLVRGHRIANAGGEAAVIADALQIDPIYIAPWIAVPALVLLFIAAFASTGSRKRGRGSRLARKYLLQKGLLLMLVLILMAPNPVWAFDTIDFSRTGEISVTIRSATTGLPVGGGSLVLYKIADAVEKEEGGYALDASGTDFKEAGEDYSSDRKLDAGMAARLAKYAESQGISGKTLPVGATGLVREKDLPLGLYLIVQKEAKDGYSAIKPFLVTVPQRDLHGNYVYKVDATPKPGTEVMPTPTRKPTPTPTLAPRLPQTGQLWWPVWVLAAAGIGCLVIGVVLRKND